MGKIDVEKSKLEIGHQCKVFTQIPLPARIKKADIIIKNSQRIMMEGYEPYFEKKVGRKSLKIIANPKHGFPHGQDILVILYLIEESKRQGWAQVIEFKNIEDYLKTFNLNRGGNIQAAHKAGFKRIYYSTWFFDDEADPNRARGIPLRIIKSWDVNFDDEKGNNPMFKSYIELTPEFLELVKNSPIPYDRKAVIGLKENTTALNLYLFLVYRTWYNWKVEKKEGFIPFFGENGLQNQLSSTISRSKHFRARFRELVKLVKSVWPECPVYLKEERNADRTPGRRSKLYLDGLFVHTTSPDQLHVPPHWDKELRLAQEEGAALAAKTVQICPLCSKGEIYPVRGKIRGDGVKMDDYYRCKACKKNIYRYQHPEIFEITL